MFRPSVLTLQKPFDIPRNHLPPHRTGLAFAELFRDRNAITTGMLGNIHALVRLANDVLRGIAMHWETGDTEAARDLVFAHHGIGRQPQTQTFCQNLSLFHARLWHENNELVSAVT